MRNLGKTIALVLVLVFLTSLVTLQPATVKALSKTITVPDDYSTIQAAIDNANTGDTVFVKEGTYSISGYIGIHIDKSISLVAQDNQKTVLEAVVVTKYSQYALIQVTADDVTITGFTINGNNIRNSTYAGSSDGIDLENNNYSHQPSDCKIIGNTIANNSFAGITTYGFSEENLISGNNITNNWDYGIYEESSDSVISENNITQNQLGIIMDSNKNVSVTQNSITDNGIYSANGPKPADSLGGLDLRFYGSYNIYENNITNNSGFGIQFDENCSNSNVYNNNIISNEIGVNVANFLFESSTDVGTRIKVYNNNMIDNGLNAFIEYASPYNITNISSYMGNGTDIVSWDNGAVGNYWSNNHGQGVYVINENNIDHHPLTQKVNISSSTPALLPILPFTIAVVIVVLAVIISLLYRRNRKTVSLSR